jgi:TPR repeat protein
MKNQDYLLVLAAILVLACALTVSAVGLPPRPPTDLCGGCISDGNERAALLGSPEEAMKIYRRYSSQSEKPERLRWARIAAENGSRAGHYEYGYMLSREFDQASKLRAVFHLRIAAKDGDEEAQHLLDVLEPALGTGQRTPQSSPALAPHAQAD